MKYTEILKFGAGVELLQKTQTANNKHVWFNLALLIVCSNQ